MKRNKSKVRKVRKQIAARKDAVDVFLNGVAVVSIWRGEDEKPQARVFEALVKADYRMLGIQLSRIATILVSESSEKAKSNGAGNVIQLPNDGKIV